MNRKRTQRLYREEGLTVRKRRGRKRATGTRAPILTVAAPNARWSVDFVHDQLGCGRRLRILNVVDDVTKECLAAVADTSISGRRVARELQALIARRGKPGLIVSDHGTEFTERHARVARGERRRLAFHRAGQTGQANAEWDLRGVQRAHARLRPWPRPCRARSMGRRLQPAPAALVARLCDTGGLCRATHRNGRSPPRNGGAPAIAHCSTGAAAPIWSSDSGFSWMKDGAHSTVIRSVGRGAGTGADSGMRPRATQAGMKARAVSRTSAWPRQPCPMPPKIGASSPARSGRIVIGSG
jgi:hypothetical protein